MAGRSVRGGMHTCVAPVAPGLSTDGVRSRYTKANGFNETNIYIKTSLIRGKVAIYLNPVLDVTSVSSSEIHSFLQLERTVSF